MISLFPYAPPPLLMDFLTVVLLGFVIGLEQREYNISENKKTFGSTRSYAFIALLGFILFHIDSSMVFYGIGLGILTLFLTIYYHYKIRENSLGMISAFTAILTYLLTPVNILFDKWFLFLFAVTIILLLGSKKRISHFVETIDSREIVTFSKFLILVGVVLPLIPKTPIKGLPVTLYQAWVAVIVISAISYLGYILQTYILKNKGILLLGVIGGIYSSTATTVVLAKKLQETPSLSTRISAAITIATTMMYIRLLIIVGIFNHDVFMSLLIPFTFLGLVSAGVTWAIYRLRITQNTNEVASVEKAKNPLELQTALVFAGLFVVVSALTDFIVTHYGSMGLSILSLIVGATDIDPFILSMLQGKFTLTSEAIAGAILLAVSSNNLLKALYSLLFGGKVHARYASLGLIFLSLLTFLLAFL